MNTADSSAVRSRIVASTLVAALAVSALTVSAAPAYAAADHTVRVHAADIGAEGASYPAGNAWFTGKSAVTASAASVGGKLVLGQKTQLLKDYKGDTVPDTAADIVADGLAVSVNAESAGDAYLQIALGWTGNWATLRPVAATKGVNTAALDDQWISSRTVGAIVKDQPATLASIVSAIDAAADGDFSYAAVGVFADSGSSTTIDSIEIDDATYVFVDGAPTVTTESVVQVRSIGVEGDSYPANSAFFFGKGSNYGTSASVSGGKLVLPTKTQVLKDYKGDSVPAHLSDVVNDGLALTVDAASEGAAFLQIAFGGKTGNVWGTLRPVVPGTTVAKLTDQWMSTRAIAGIAANTPAPLGSFLSAIDTATPSGFSYVAVGVVVDSGTAAIESLQIAGEKFTFANDALTVAKTTAVQLRDFGVETTSYPAANAFFFGNGTGYGKVATIVGGELVLPTKTQLLKDFKGATVPSSLGEVVKNGLSVSVDSASAGDAFLQIAFGGKTAGIWGTLRPVVAGSNVATLGDMWLSTRAIGSIPANTPVALGTLITAIDAATPTGFSYVAVGVVTDGGAATIESLQVAGEKFVFANSSKIAITSATITGTHRVGEVLSAKVVANFTGVTVKYQWYRNGVALKNKTAAAYRIAAADLGKKITVKVTVSKSGLKAVSRTVANSTKVTSGVLGFTTAPTINGATIAVGKKLTVSAAAKSVASSAAATSYTYQWYRNGAAIKKATKSSYSLVFADLGKTITVKVTAKLTGYSAKSATSGATTAVIEGTLSGSTPKLTGTMRLGKVVTATAGKWTAGTTLKYEWSVNGEVVQLSASKTLKLTWEHKGAVTVKVIGSQQGYTKLISASSAARTFK